LPRCFFEIKTVSMNSDPYEVWSVNMTTALSQRNRQRTTVELAGNLGVVRT